MATDIQSFSDTELRMRWQEPYLTEGLNAKQAVHTPRGTYRGFRLASNPLNLTISVKPDRVSQDHVAVYETRTGYSITIRRTGGQFNLSLAAFLNQTVVIAIYANYAIGLSTSAVIRVYQLAPIDEFTGAAERSELVILGTVVVPAAPRVIADSAIRATNRTEAWEAVAVDAVPWAPILQNSSFEWVLGGGKFFIERWEQETSVNWATVATANSGNVALRLIGAVAAQSGRFYQWTNIPIPHINAQGVVVAPAPPVLLRLRLFVRVMLVPTAGTVQIFVEWGDQNGNVSPAETLIAVPATAVDAVFRGIDVIIDAPAGAFFIRRVGLKVTNLAFAAAGDAFYFDDFQCYVESNGPLTAPAHTEKFRSEVSAYPLILGDPTTNLSALAGMMRFDSTTPVNEGQIIVDYSNENTPATLSHVLNNRGRLQLGDRLLVSAAQAMKPRITIEQSPQSLYTLLFELPTSLGLPITRIYSYLGASIAITENAFWDAGTNQWKKDTADQIASRLLLSFDGLSHSWEEATLNAPWADTAWNQNPIQLNSINFTNVLSGALSLGLSLLSTNTTSLIPRLRWDIAPTATATRTCLWQSNSAGSYPSRFYRLDLTGDVEFVQNARWNGTNWTRDVPGFNSTRLGLTDNTCWFQYYDKADVNLWIDTSWSDTRRMLYTAATKTLDVGDGSVRFRNVTTGIDGSNPPRTTVLPNTLVAANTPKAWGNIRTDGAGGISSVYGFGTSGVGLGLTGLVTVNFSYPFVDTNYAVVFGARATFAATPPWESNVRMTAVPIVYGQTLNSFQFYWSVGDAISPVDTSTVMQASFAVFGQQA